MSRIYINDEIKKLGIEAEKECKPYFDAVDEVALFNSEKVLNAFLENGVSYQDFTEINGYAFFDEARDKIEKVFAQILGAEDALVRAQIMSGTNAIYLTLSGLLHPGDTMICIAGTPYDPLQEIMGIRGESPLSLTRNGVSYEQIDLTGDDFDYDAIKARIEKGGVNLVEIQRSCGYSHRRGLSIEKIEKVCKLIKSIDENVIIMCDNCYGELVEKKEPTEVGVDIMAGSLMHNMGGGIATSGGYVAGRADLIDQVADRLTSPGMGKYLGANYNQNIKFLKGIFMAPRTVANAVKTAILTSYLVEKMGLPKVVPRYNEYRSDIIQTFDFENEEDLIHYCQSLQSFSPVDSNYASVPCEMPGYPHDEIMSAGTFAQGSTIELTCDGPVVAPYTVFQQGSLTYETGKLSVMAALTKMKEEREN
ncbi:MAG: methionine gamma-lyase family protein [Lachnospiraceae bacterium]|nr:methionine gamma-lyase family protein [Lachnospiraceae bacterium]